MNRRSLLIANATKGGGGELPAEYQEVEWLLSDGSAYIRTTYIPQSKIDITCVVYTPTTTFSSNIDRFLFGSYGGGNLMFLEPLTYDGIEIIWKARNGYAIFNNITTGIGTKSIIHCYDDVFEIDGVQKTTSQRNSGIPTVPIYLFAWNRNGSAGYQNSVMPMGRLTIKENNVTMFDVIPCYRKSDNVIGMYDVVSQTFLAGTNGTFTKGADVNA